MTDPLDELGRDLWPTLYYLARRGPRLASTWGRCPTCGLPASRALRFVDATWSWCSPCAVRWPVDALLADLDPDTDEERGFRDLLELAGCVDLSPLPEHVAPPVTRITEENMSRETMTTDAPMIDPWAGLPAPKGGGDDFSSMPMNWDRLPESMRAEIGAAILRAIADRPAPTLRDAGSIAHCAWAHARTNPRIDRTLSDATFPALAMITSAVRKLIGGGDVLEHLRQRRAELDRQIEALEKMRGETIAS